MTAIHAIILTLDEAQHIARCIESIEKQCATITVIDSGSKDGTVEIAEGLGAQVLFNPFVTHAGQVNYAIDKLADRGGWLLRIDADELLDKDSRQTLGKAIETAGSDVDGILMQRRIHFLGRRITHGGIEPSWQLRLWRNGSGRCEQRWMDEHILVAGKVAKSQIVFSDINLNSLTWWTAKHNSYASREAIDILNHRYGFLPGESIRGAGASAQAKFKRFIKERIYLKIPSGGRAFLYFLYRSILCFGFLDGRAGWYFHVLQGFWYRSLVDAKVNEILACAKDNDISVVEAIRDRTGIDLSAAVDGRAQQRIGSAVERHAD